MQMDVSQIGQWFGSPSGVRDEMVLVMTILHVYTLSEPPMVEQRPEPLFSPILLLPVQPTLVIPTTRSSPLQVLPVEGKVEPQASRL
jgi:hypothetical protein